MSVTCNVRIPGFERHEPIDPPNAYDTGDIGEDHAESTDRLVFSGERAMSFDSFRLIPKRQLLLKDGAPVHLGSRALEILILLVERAGELVSRDELMAGVWPDVFVEENTLRVHMSYLRRALGDGRSGRRYLINIPGRGYRFVAPINWCEAETEPAPAATAGGPDNNLPASKMRALGREEKIRVLQIDMTKHRLITIVGPCGVGKTAVALAVAESALRSYEDGVWFVDLALLDDAALIPNALAAAIGLAVDGERTAPRLVDQLRHKKMLIVLDSCEHVVTAAAALAEHVLAEAPGVRILATSREPLCAYGERVSRLLPLGLPADTADLSVSDIIAYPSVQLFIERTAAYIGGFQLTDADAPIVADICRKLDGIPLAIELAAARVDAFGLRQLSLLLDDRFRILNKGGRTATPRHRSLDAALDWSYDFLPEAERALLRRLSLFSNAFTLDMVLALATDDGMDMADGIANLVAKSLIVADTDGPVVQYRLLDFTRAYVLGKMVANGEFQAPARSSQNIPRDGATAQMIAFQDYCPATA
jgi:predicted ATPase/DNA-binding winged helix-turn-helix (wHTH) protein